MKHLIHMVCAASLVAVTLTSCKTDDPQTVTTPGTVVGDGNEAGAGSLYSYSRLRGEGSAESPYRIGTREDFEYFLTALKDDPLNAHGLHFELTDDITLQPYSDNTALTGAVFRGSLQGHGHTVGPLVFDGTHLLASAEIGLFSEISDAEISGLIIRDVRISGVHTGAGALAGRARGRVVVSDVSAAGSVSGDLNTGGLIGEAEGELHVSGVSVDMTVRGGDRTGGLIGAFAHQSSDASEFMDTEVKGEVDGSNYTGGLIGLLKATKAPKAGGIEVTASVRGAEDVGGFVGRMDKCILDLTADCTYAGARRGSYSIEGTSDVGGFAGYIDLNGACYLHLDSHAMNLNAAIHAGNGNAGGVAGFAKDGHIKVNKVNLGYDGATVVADGDCVGGLFGRLEGVYLLGDHSVNVKKELPAAGSYTPHVAIPVRGRDYVGGCVGYAERTRWGDPLMPRGSITGLVCRADVTALGEIAGGVAGWFEGNMNDCVFSGTVRGMSDGIIGGIVGKAQEYIDMYRCVNYSDIAGGKYQGGICGYANPAKADGEEYFTDFTDCYNIGSLKDGMTVGGIVGYAGQRNGGCSFRIRQCENYGAIDAAGNADHSVGGLVGDVDNDEAIVEWSANYADVHSRKVQFVIGGVVGKIGRSQITQNDVHVTGCTNLGTVTCDDRATKIGGIVGHMMYGGAGIVAGCVNWGAIPGDQKSDTGGILGCATSFNYIHRNWNRGTVSHGNAIVGTHPGGTTFDHYGNYYLQGSGKNWPDAIEITADQMTHASFFPLLTWGPNQDYIGYTGEWFQMSTEGPVTMSFDFIHWDVAKLRPAGWHVER